MLSIKRVDKSTSLLESLGSIINILTTEYKSDCHGLIKGQISRQPKVPVLWIIG